MAEELKFTEFTYTYDQFTVFFYGDRIFIGGKDHPIGQCCVDIMNLNDAVLDEIDQRVKMFIPRSPQSAHRKNRQRRSSRAGEAERCLGYHLFFAGLPGSENGRALQLSHLPVAYGRQGQVGTGTGPEFGRLLQVPGDDD